MKPSPLQLEPPTYPILSVRSVPDNDKKLSNGPLPVDVNATVCYDSDGTHFAYLSIEQNDDAFPYLVEIDVFASFSIDVDGCRQAYKTAFNPGVVAVNIARILYSGAREMLGLLTSRGPHGGANLPSLMIEPSDVNIEFERDKLDVILAKNFGFAPEAIQATLARLEHARVAQADAAKAIASPDDANAGTRLKTAVAKEPAAKKAAAKKPAAKKMAAKKMATKKPAAEKLTPRKVPRARR
jgi:predicted RecB family endonuclease